MGRLQAKLFQSVSSKTHFSRSEVEGLYSIFQGLVGGPDSKMDRMKFRETMHSSFGITDDLMLDRSFRIFNVNNDGLLSFEEWATGYSTILRGTDEQLTRYCFEIYDYNGNGQLSREELFHLLKTSLIRQINEEDPDEGVKDLVELAIKRMDLDHDNQISFEEYIKAVESEPLLMEAFGSCIPEESFKYAFQTTLESVLQS